jgi:hypothetical protein
MRFLAYLPLLVVGIAVAAFLVKLFVSLRVVSRPVWQEPGDEEPEATNMDSAAAGIRAEQISLDADALPDQRPLEQQCPAFPGEQAHIASRAVRQFSPEPF